MRVENYIFLLALLLTGCRERRNNTVNSQLLILNSQLPFQADTVRFGMLRDGEIGVRRLLLRNDSSEPLVVVRHEVTCGCVSVEYDRKPLAAGETMPLAIRFDARGAEGWQMKLLRLYIAGKEEPYRVFVEADVIQ